MKRVILILLSLPAIAWSALPDWQQNLSPPQPGPFPGPPALKASYRFGWMGISAGEAEAVLAKTGKNLQLKVSGGSTGVARDIWKLDATNAAKARASTLRPLHMSQTEDYGWKKTVTELSFNDRAVTCTQRTTPPENAPAQKQKIQFPNLRDLFTAMLYIRSQRLAAGDSYSLVVFPANAAYCATVHVEGREKIQVRAGKFNAIRLDIRLQKVTQALTLEPHTKFKHATAWVSDDENRILLRVDGEIFVGSVWMELQGVKYPGR